MVWKPKQSKSSAISRLALNIPRIRRIAFTFWFAFCLAFASSSASGQEVDWAQQIYNILSGVSQDSYMYFVTYPSLDFGGSTWEQFLGPALFENGVIDNRKAYLALMYALLQSQVAHSTNFYSRAGNVLFPAHAENLYQLLDNRSYEGNNLLYQIEQSLSEMSHWDYSLVLANIQDYVQSCAYDINSISEAIRQATTVSGADNFGNPAIEANDSYTHALLLDLASKLQDIESNQQGSGGDVGALYQEAQAINMRLMDMAQEQIDFAQDWRKALEKVMRDNWRDVNPEKEGIQVFDALTHMSITNLMRNDRKIPGSPSQAVHIYKDGLQVFDPYAKLGYQYNTNFWKGFVQNLVVGSGTNRAIRVVSSDLISSNLQQIASFYQQDDRIALDTNSVVVATATNTNLVDNAVEEKALEEKAAESTEDFEKEVEDQQKEAQDAVDELVSTVDESFDEIKEQLDPGQHEETLLNGLAPSTFGGSSKLLIWNAWDYSGIHVPKLEIDFGDKRLENFRKRANLILRSCYWLAFCLTAINLLRSLAIYLFSLGHVNEVAANALDAVGASGWQSSSDPWETVHYAEWMNGGAMRELEESRNHK